MTHGPTSLPSAAIRSVLDAIRRGEPWRRALQTVVRASGTDEALRVIANEACGNWIWLTTFERREVALDVGGVVSSMAPALSRHFGIVHHVESSPLLAEFAARRFAQDGLANVTVSRASESALPFRDGTFDCVSLHGTLPRVAADVGSPIIQRVLADCHRVLRANGQIFLSFDNPAWYAGFRPGSGRRDLERTIVPFMLTAGFRDPRRFYAFPSFDRPGVLVPATRRAFYARETVEASGTLRRVIRRAAAYAGFYPVLAPSVLIIART